MQYAGNFTVDNININCKLARHVLHINLIDSSSLHIGSANLMMHQGLMLTQEEMHMLVLFCGVALLLNRAMLPSLYCPGPADVFSTPD